MRWCLVAALGVWLLAACGGRVQGDGERCDPLTHRQCVGVNACQGVQQCSYQGTGWGGCTCTAGGSGGTTGGGPGSGGSGVGGGVGGVGVGGGVGSGGSGTGGFGDGRKLGSACNTRADCGGVLECVSQYTTLWDEAGDWPAKGTCTLPCKPGDGLCSGIQPSARCRQVGAAPGAWCVQGCQLGPPTLQDFDLNKCHGRQEVACAVVPDATGVVETSCLPTCNFDGDCAPGFCNFATGLCQPYPQDGSPSGAPCKTSGECAGECLAPLGPSGLGVCAGRCTLGSLPTCGWSGPNAGPAESYCLIPAAGSGDVGVGDLGRCGQLCNCSGECRHPDQQCVPFDNATLENAFQKKGYCSFPSPGDATLPCP